MPTPAFWPMLVVATLASVVASQALISGVFSIVRQAANLGVLPRLTVTHTDEAVEGQIYIGAVNWALFFGCVAMVAGFQDTTAMGHAYVRMRARAPPSLPGAQPRARWAAGRGRRAARGRRRTAFARDLTSAPTPPFLTNGRASP